jgi:hypothetical protein
MAGSEGNGDGRVFYVFAGLLVLLGIIVARGLK